MKTTIAESSLASINLLNALQRINREQEQVSENQICLAQFEKCKLLRRHVLRYIQHVETEEWLGALIQANDQLVTALMTFEQLDRSIDADSDSDDELAEQAHAYRSSLLPLSSFQILSPMLIPISAHRKGEVRRRRCERFGGTVAEWQWS